jgi:5'-nucleotidase
MNVTVVAPATNQSGTGDKSTPAALTATDVTTVSGYAAKAVAGFPADSVNWAMDGGIPLTFDLVVSGSNLGQNYGPLRAISGTVGAAATAARRGVPAIAISQGLPADGTTFDFPSSVAVLSEHLDSTIDDYRNGVGPALVSINVPTCPAGVALLPTLHLISAASDNGRTLGAATACDGNPANPVDDIDGFNAGHGVISQLDPTTLAGIAP